MIRPVIVVTHASFDEKRRATLMRLEEQLAGEGIPWEVIEDADRAGSLDCWRRAMAAGLEHPENATHIVWLADDVILCKGFGVALRKAIAAQSEQVFDFVVNHTLVHDAKWNPDAKDAPTKIRLEDGWYTTPDGYVGGVMPRAALLEHLMWREGRLGWDQRGSVDYIANDHGVNLWAMETGRLIWKTARSLVDHDTSIPSLDGNDAHDFRRPLNFIADATELEGWDKPPARLPPTYRGNHWAPLWNDEAWSPEWSYRAARGGASVSTRPHVFIAMPAYVTPELAVRKSVERVCADLLAHGIEATCFETSGDSLVTRGRHILVHEMMLTTATHLLQWDADIECLDATAVRMMLESGHDVVGGAYPFRDGSGRVVANPPSGAIDPSTGHGAVDVDPKTKCLKVAEVGTGFLLTSRKCLVALMRKHPELLYEADIDPYTGAPMWALFDVHLEMRGSGRRRYASEDWRFCQLAREAGYPVLVYYPPIFRHWGKTAHQGHIVKAWQMNQPTQAAAE